MIVRQGAIAAMLLVLAVFMVQTGACEGKITSDNTIAEVYMGEDAVKMKGYVQQVFRDVLFALTNTLEDIPPDLERVEITIKPHDVIVLVNGEPLQIKSFIEELYREIGIGILTAMGESPDRSGEFRIILYAT
ncbi:hypothetical protein AMJ86_04810 [bacterium SM23_57]|nr:MAG: hypothetical protein AMJ86_04810 [bacterium SM23_57]